MFCVSWSSVELIVELIVELGNRTWSTTNQVLIAGLCLNWVHREPQGRHSAGCTVSLTSDMRCHIWSYLLCRDWQVPANQDFWTVYLRILPRLFSKLRAKPGFFKACRFQATVFLSTFSGGPKRTSFSFDCSIGRSDKPSLMPLIFPIVVSATLPTPI